VAREAGLAALDCGESSLAVQLCSSAVDNNPDDIGLIANLALAYMLHGDDEEGVACARRAVDLDPEDEVSLNALKYVQEVANGQRSRPHRLNDAFMTNKELFSPGFLLSKVDIRVLLAGTLGSVLVARLDPPLGAAVAFTVAHFFLFCNVLRMARSLELIWAALFVLLAGSSILQNLPLWSHTFAAMLVITFILAVFQFRKPSYHGVFWQRINPQLPHWWASKGTY
jgi:tetratricopeptide (TPR) repeat protein